MAEGAIIFLLKVVYFSIERWCTFGLTNTDKKLNSLSNQMIELDLDDGVKVNYEKLGEILYKVKM